MDFRGYLELMTVLEEEYTGASLLTEHSLFNPIAILAQKKKIGKQHPSTYCKLYKLLKLL